jgi:hypothetical protein
VRFAVGDRDCCDGRFEGLSEGCAVGRLPEGSLVGDPDGIFVDGNKACKLVQFEGGGINKFPSRDTIAALRWQYLVGIMPVSLLFSKFTICTFGIKSILGRLPLSLLFSSNIICKDRRLPNVDGIEPLILLLLRTSTSSE